MSGPQNGLYKSQTFYGSGNRIVRIDNFYDGILNPQESFRRVQIEPEELALYKLNQGDILVNRVNSMTHIGKCANIKGLTEETVFESNIMRFALDSQIAHTQYVVHFLTSPSGLKEIRKNAKQAVNQASINQQDVKGVEIFLPPLPVQHQIVAKIEELFSELDAGVQELKTALARLKTYRQAVLHHYLNNPDWERVKLGDVVKRVFDGPFGSNLKTSDYIPQPGYQVIRLENVGRMEFIGEKETFISEDKFTSLEKHEIFDGDIVFSSFVGENVRATLIPQLKYKAINKADCFCIRTDENQVNRKFLVYSLSTERVHKTVTLDVHGATRPRINTSQLKNLEMPFPGLTTQTQIVSEIEARLSEADAMEATIRQELVRAENLRQSILKQAFEGKLITTSVDKLKLEELEAIPELFPVYEGRNAGSSGDQLSLF
nr:restriction endonuclease subunit S [Spirosoma sp. KCTC 42546]